MFAAIMVMVIGLSLAARNEVRHQEHALLKERATEIKSNITQIVAGLESQLRPLGSLVATTNADQTAFQTQAQTIRATRQNGAIMVVRQEDGKQIVVLSSSPLYPIGSGLLPEAAQAVERAESVDPQSQLHVATTGVTHTDQPRIGIAYHSQALPKGTNLFLDIPISALATLVQSELTSFGPVNLNFYAAPETQQNQLVYSTQDPEHHTGETLRDTVPLGADSWSFTLQSRNPIAGNVTHTLPWIIFSVGTCIAIALAVVVESLLRRKDYALALVVERTQELSESLRVRDKRAMRDQLFQRTARDVAAAPDLAEAFSVFSATLNDLIAFDRCNLSIVNDDSARVVAVGGRYATSLPIGTVWTKSDELIEQVLRTRQSEIAEIDTQVATFGPHMVTRMAVPMIVGGTLRALITMASEQHHAFTQQDLQNADQLVRETAGPLYLLLVIDREREASNRLQELDALKNEFIGMVAHDLRSPMTVISGFADFLDQHRNSLEEEETHLYLKRISDNTKQLAAFVEDVLQVARIESGELKVVPQAFDIAKLIRSTVEGFAIINTEHVLNVSAPKDLPLVAADEGQQWQIINNLISNALKFSDSPTTVDIRLHSDANFVYVRVTDNGPGIEPEAAQHVFDRFYRAERNRGLTQPAGTGLGLHICKSLVEAHGGTISLSTKLGQGTSFTYSVPRADLKIVSLRDNAPTTRGATS